MSALAAQFDLLWQLRDVDAEVVAARERAERALRSASSFEATAAAAKRKHDEAKLKLRDLEHRERDTEVEIKSLQQRLGLLEDQANSATSDSIRKHSVEAVEKQRKRLDELENAGLTLLDDIEKAKTAVTAAEAAARVAADRAAAEVGAAIGQKAIADGREKELAPRRKEIAAQVQAELLHAYDSARVRNPDSPMCGLKGTYCEGCGGELNMHHTSRVKGRTELLRCPHCTRIHDVRV